MNFIKYTHGIIKIPFSGIDTEGVYRVSGSRVHADQLLAKFLANPSSVDLVAMDIPIYNVTTALKTYLTDQTPPVIPQSFVDDLHELNCKIFFQFQSPDFQSHLFVTDEIRSNFKSIKIYFNKNFNFV